MLSFSSFLISFILIMGMIIIPFYIIMSILTMGLESTLNDLGFCFRNIKYCCNKVRDKLSS